MTKLTLTVLICIAAVLSVSGCGRRSTTEPVEIHNEEELAEAIGALSSEPDDAERWTAVCTYYTEQRRFSELISTVEPVIRRADSIGFDLKTKLTIYLSQAYLFNEEFDKSNSYISRIDIGRDKPEPQVLISYHNIRAILALKRDIDYSQALWHLRAALTIAKQEHLDFNYCSLLCNIASIYYDREDLTGMRYAKEAYELSERLGNKYARCFSAILMAQMLYLSGNQQEALAYADIAQQSLGPDQENTYSVPLGILRGDIAATRKEWEKAEAYYRQVLGTVREEEPANTIEALLKYGRLKLAEGQYGEASKLFAEALQISYETDNIENRHKILLGLSDTYFCAGDKSAALEYYKAYHALADSISLIQRERDFHRLLMNYDKMEYESRLHESEMDIQKSHRQNIIICSVLACTTLILGWVYSLYRKKNLMFQQLAEQHRTYMSRVKMMTEAAIDAGSGEDKACTKDAQLFETIEKTMSADKLYRNKDICVDKLSELLGTNRSYISRAINRYAGMSFTNYINMKRIEEATSILSSDDKGIPIKVLADDLGFSSVSSFSRVFLRETGCPPSKYREYARNDAGTKNEDNVG